MPAPPPQLHMPLPLLDTTTMIAARCTALTLLAQQVVDTSGLVRSPGADVSRREQRGPGGVDQHLHPVAKTTTLAAGMCSRPRQELTCLVVTGRKSDDWRAAVAAVHVNMYAAAKGGPRVSTT